MRRHVALAGAVLRPRPGLSLNIDYEGSPGDKTFFRTGLMRYHRGRVRLRNRIHQDLTFNMTFGILDNENPQPDIELDFQSKQASASLYWTPGGGERFSVLADYTWLGIRSDIQILTLPFFGTDFSRYRDSGHHAGVFADVVLHRQVRLRAGGALSINSGSRPTKYYQPRATVIVPAINGVRWVSEWRWYGLNEEFLRFENFRAHAFSTGVQLDL